MMTSPQDFPVGLLVFVVLFVGLVLLARWSNRSRSNTFAPGTSANQKSLPPIVVETYKGSAETAAREFHNHAVQMAERGYFPVSQSYTPGAYTCGEFLVALLLVVVFIGIIVFIYMLFVKPPGTLSVTYELRPRSSPPPVLPPVPIVGGEKTCPRCAETVKGAALVCRYCGHEFPPEKKESIV